MKKLNAKNISETLAHNQVPRKALIKVGDSKTKLQTVNEAYLEPGKGFTPHTHNDSEEIYYFLEGEGTMVIDNKKIKIKTGDVVTVEVGESHTLKNTSAKKLRFLTIRVLI
jgi:mannose-6-phosphate isomerase-like protein (cupin superfamily)